ncbi:MAG: hypothetical protein DCF24_06710, partial [Cyanobium sp.]
MAEEIGLLVRLAAIDQQGAFEAGPMAAGIPAGAREAGGRCGEPPAIQADHHFLEGSGAGREGGTGQV